MKKLTVQFLRNKIGESSGLSFSNLLFRKIMMALMVALMLPVYSFAATITFTTSFKGGNQWTYDYVITAAPEDPAIEEFTIYFDVTRYSNLAIKASPAGWDPLIVDPDVQISADGFFDALSLNSGISPGAKQGGFTVLFDFLGAGTPGSQRFDIIDPNTFATLSTGLTSALITPPPPSNVPEPNTLVLALLGLTLLLSRGQRQSDSL